jgi:hypothetical protein
VIPAWLPTMVIPGGSSPGSRYLALAPPTALETPCRARDTGEALYASPACRAYPGVASGRWGCQRQTTTAAVVHRRADLALCCPSDELVGSGDVDRLASRVHAELAVDAFLVSFDGVFGDEQFGGDFAVGQAAGEILEHGNLAGA